MNKKARNVLSLVILTVLCLVLFVSCSSKTPDINTYSDKDLGIMGRLVQLMHHWIGNYGWTVVVFTVFLKILMLPLDFWQRYASRKSSLKMQQMQPIIEGIDKKYGANTQRANEEKQKLYKKQGFSMMSSCLPLIVSMVIFFVVFAGLRDYSAYSSITNFKTLSNVYYESYEEQIKNPESDYYNVELEKVYQDKYDAVYESAKKSGDSEDVAKFKGRKLGVDAVEGKYKDTCNVFKAAAIEAVQNYYIDNHESWLWIENVWQPDTWASVMQPYDGGSFAGGSFKSSVNLQSHPDQTAGEETYKIIRDAVLQTGGHGKNGTWNGLMILPLMSIGLSFLSMYISQRMEKKNRNGEVVQQNAQQAASNKMMMIIMPLMMAFFGFMYTGAFSIYMVVNYSLSILTTIAMRWPVEMFVNRNINKADKNNKSGKATYMR